jgi:hypothetical protein
MDPRASVERSYGVKIRKRNERPAVKDRRSTVEVVIGVLVAGCWLLAGVKSLIDQEEKGQYRGRGWISKDFEISKD